MDTPRLAASLKFICIDGDRKSHRPSSDEKYSGSPNLPLSQQEPWSEVRTQVLVGCRVFRLDSSRCRKLGTLSLNFLANLGYSLVTLLFLIVGGHDLWTAKYVLKKVSGNAFAGIPKNFGLGTEHVLDLA